MVWRSEKKYIKIALYKEEAGLALALRSLLAAHSPMRPSSLLDCEVYWNDTFFFGNGTPSGKMFKEERCEES